MFVIVYTVKMFLRDSDQAIVDVLLIDECESRVREIVDNMRASYKAVDEQVGDRETKIEYFETGTDTWCEVYDSANA